MNTIRTLKIASTAIGLGGLAVLAATAIHTASTDGNVDSVRASGSNPTAYSTASFVKPTAPRMQMGGTMGETTTTPTPSP